MIWSATISESRSSAVFSGRDRRIFGSDHVDARIRARGRVAPPPRRSRGRSARSARAASAARALRSSSRAHAQPGDLVVELHFQPVAWRSASLLLSSRSRSALATSQPDWPSIGATCDSLQASFAWRRRSAVHVRAASPQTRKARGELQGDGHAPSCDDIYLPVGHDDHFSRRFFRFKRSHDLVGSQGRAPLPPPSARPLGSTSVSRSLPIDLPGDRHFIVDQQGRIHAGHSGVDDQPGHCPIAAQASSAICGTIGATMRASVRMALVREAEGGLFDRVDQLVEPWRPPC